MSDLGLVLRQKLHSIPSHLPLSLSLTRIALTPIVWSLLGTASSLALLVYLTACATDLLDGKSARLLNSSSYNGTVLDASADFILVAAGFTYYVALGLVSPILLVVMSFSFLQYLLTMEIPIRDRLGKHVGTTLFFLLAVVMLYPTSLTSMVTSIIGVSYIVASLINRFQGIRAYRARICLLQTHPSDCVVSDYQIPNMNGVKLCYEIKKHALGVPCIIYTGHRSEEIVTEAFSVGIDDYVRKEEELGHYKVLARKIRTPWIRGALMVDTARAH